MNIKQTRINENCIGCIYPTYKMLKELKKKLFECREKGVISIIDKSCSK